MGKETAISRSRLRSLFLGLIPLFVLAHLSHHLVTALPAPLLPYIRDEFALDYTQAGFVLAAFGVVYGAFQLPGGWLADRIGPRRLLTIGIAGVGLTGFMVGISPTYILVLASLVLMGILGGGYHPAATTMICAAVEPKHRGQALGYHMIGGSISYFLAPLIAAGIAVAWGWRAPFIGLAIPSVALGVFLHIIVGRRIPTSRSAPQATAGERDEVPHTPHRVRRLITLITLSTFNQAMLMSIVSFVPLLLVDDFGSGKGAAAASMSLVYGMGLWAGPLGGYLSDRFGPVRMILTMCFLAGGLFYLLALAPFAWNIQLFDLPLEIFAILIALGTAMYINTTASQAFIVDQTSERRRSTLLGLYFFGNMEGSGILTPVLGFLLDRLGFDLSFTIAGVALFAITFSCAMLLWVSRR
jgi:MFS family permease